MVTQGDIKKKSNRNLNHGPRQNNDGYSDTPGVVNAIFTAEIAFVMLCENNSVVIAAKDIGASIMASRKLNGIFLS